MNKLNAYYLGALLAFGLTAAQAEPARVATPVIPGASAQILPDFADLVEKYGPAVVNMNTQTRAKANQQIPGLSEDDPFYEFFRRFMPPDGNRNAPGPRGRQQPQQQPDAPRGPLRPFGLGSGFIVSPDG